MNGIVWIVFELVDGTLNGRRELVQVFDNHDVARDFAEQAEADGEFEAWDIDRCEVH